MKHSAFTCLSKRRVVVPDEIDQFKFYSTKCLVKIWQTIWHVILSPFGRQRASAHFFKYPSSWSDRINKFRMAAIIRFDLDVS